MELLPLRQSPGILKKLLSETIIYGIGAILPRIILFVLNPLYIIFIPREEFAQFTSLYALVSFVNILLTFGFETAFFRFASEKGREKKVLSTAFWFTAVISGVFLLLTTLFSTQIASGLGYSSTPEYIRWFAMIAFFDALTMIPLAYLRFKNRPITYSAIRVGQSLIQTLLVLALFFVIPRELSKDLGLEQNVSIAFFSNLVGSIASALMLIPIFLKIRFSMDRALLKRMVPYAFPVMVAGFAFMVNENFDKAVQIYFISKEQAGAYGGVYKLAVVMTLFVTAYRMGIEPYFFKQMYQADAKNTYAKITEYFTLFGSVAALAIITNISWLKLLFIPNESYWIALDIIPFIVLANLCFGIYYNLSTWYKVTDRTLVGTYLSWLGAALTIALNLLLLKRYGFMVSAYATLLVYFVMMVFSYLLGQKYYPIPYRVGKISLILALLVGASFLSFEVFDQNLWIGNLILLLFCGTILLVFPGLLNRKST